MYFCTYENLYLLQNISHRAPNWHVILISTDMRCLHIFSVLSLIKQPLFHIKITPQLLLDLKLKK